MMKRAVCSCRGKELPGAAYMPIQCVNYYMTNENNDKDIQPLSAPNVRGSNEMTARQFTANCRHFPGKLGSSITALHCNALQAS